MYNPTCNPLFSLYADEFPAGAWRRVESPVAVQLPSSVLRSRHCVVAGSVTRDLEFSVMIPFPGGPVRFLRRR